MQRRNPIPNWDIEQATNNDHCTFESNAEVAFLPGVLNHAFDDNNELNNAAEQSTNRNLPAQFFADLSRISLPDYDYLPTSGTLRLQRSPWSRFGNHVQLTNVNSLTSETTATVVRDLEKTNCCGKTDRKCCLNCFIVVTRLRWILVTIAIMGAISVIAGITFGVLNITLGNSFLTLSLTFIGLGVLLVFVVGIGWRWSPPDHEPCHALFGISSNIQNSSRDVTGRSSLDTWYGGMLYPEFAYVTPPPSYHATMQQNPTATISTQSSASHIIPMGYFDNMSVEGGSYNSVPPAYSIVRCGLSTHSSVFEEEDCRNKKENRQCRSPPPSLPSSPIFHRSRMQAAFRAITSARSTISELSTKSLEGSKISDLKISDPKVTNSRRSSLEKILSPILQSSLLVKSSGKPKLDLTERPSVERLIRNFEQNNLQKNSVAEEPVSTFRSAIPTNDNQLMLTEFNRNIDILNKKYNYKNRASVEVHNLKSADINLSINKFIDFGEIQSTSTDVDNIYLDKKINAIGYDSQSNMSILDSIKCFENTVMINTDPAESESKYSQNITAIVSERDSNECNNKQGVINSPTGIINQIETSSDLNENNIDIYSGKIFGLDEGYSLS